MISRRQHGLASAKAELRIAREACREAEADFLSSTNDVEDDPLWGYAQEARELLNKIEVLRMKAADELYKA